jgi:hypothetical protein
MIYFVLSLVFQSIFSPSCCTIQFHRYFSSPLCAIRFIVFYSTSIILIVGNCTTVTYDFPFTLCANISVSCPVILFATVLNYSLYAQTLKSFIESTNSITVTLSHCHRWRCSSGVLSSAPKITWIIGTLFKLHNSTCSEYYCVCLFMNFHKIWCFMS